MSTNGVVLKVKEATFFAICIVGFIIRNLVARQTKKQKISCIATWRFGSIAVEAAAKKLCDGGSALDAVEIGTRAVELLSLEEDAQQLCVGWRGNPRSDGRMYYDSAIMCGKTHRYGAVMSMPKCSTPVQVARSVLQNSPHNVFVGEGALRFAQECSANTLTITDKLHPKSRIEYNQWKKKLQKGKTSKNVPLGQGAHSNQKKTPSFQHDTVGVICLDRNGDLAVATSTSGWAFVREVHVFHHEF